MYPSGVITFLYGILLFKDGDKGCKIDDYSSSSLGILNFAIF